MSDDIIPHEGGRYLILIMWGPEVPATYKNGKFIPDGEEKNSSHHLSLKYVNILEELP